MKPSTTSPLGLYDVTVEIASYEPDREISWLIDGAIDPPLGHVYGYRLEPVDGGTQVTSYCDWSNLHENYREMLTVPHRPRVRPAGHAGHPGPNRGPGVAPTGRHLRPLALRPGIAPRPSRLRAGAPPGPASHGRAR